MARGREPADLQAEGWSADDRVRDPYPSQPPASPGPDSNTLTIQYICTSLDGPSVFPPVPQSSAAESSAAQSSAAPPGAAPLAAERRVCGGIDLHRLLIPHPASTFLLRVSGDSMTGAGIRPGDLLIVDRALAPRPGHVVVALLEGAFTLKRLVHRRGGWWLEAAHPAYPPLALETTRDPAGRAADVRLWGVALHAIRRL